MQTVSPETWSLAVEVTQGEGVERRQARGSQTIVQGDGYWIALLGTGGKLNYLDTTSGTASSYVDSSPGLSSLPQTFSAGAEYNVSPVSAYVNGTAGTPAMLVGDKSVAPSSDSNGAGFTQAFSYQAATSGTTTDIDLYVNSGTTATNLAWRLQRQWRPAG